MHSKVSNPTPINCNRLKIPEYARGVVNKFLKRISLLFYYEYVPWMAGLTSYLPTQKLRVFSNLRTLPYLTHSVLFPALFATMMKHSAWHLWHCCNLHTMGWKKNLRKNLYFYTRVFSRYFFLTFILPKCMKV